MFKPGMESGELKRRIYNGCPSTDYDYVRFTLADINGSPRGKVITARNIDKFIDEGLGCYGGTLAMGPLSELPVKTMDKKICQKGHPNMVIVPDLSTFHDIPWANYNKGTKVAELLCTSNWLDGTPQKECPRYIAREAITKLDDMGLVFQSAFEIEFKVFRKDDRKPLFDGPHAFAQTITAQYEEFLFDLEKNLEAIGINIETIQTEYSPGQFEFTLKPTLGLKAVDDFFVFKNTVKELCNKRGYIASFMAKPSASDTGSGAHFNFSILKKSDNGNNVLYDGNKKDNMSDFMKHFLAGILLHVDALTALCCPTVNCYRRLHTPWAPDLANWEIEDRRATIRVKNDGPTRTYFENRLPSGLANPYLVLAGTIAAGLDGVNRKISCPPASDKKAASLPKTLSSALEALRADKVMVEGVGADCIEWFINMKREIDLENLKNSDVSIPDEAAIKAEINQYETLC